MQVLVIVAVAVVLVGFLLVSLLASGFDVVAKSFADTKKAREQKRAERRARAEADTASALAAAEQAEIDAYRSENPVRIVGIPNPGVYRRSFAVLDDFAVSANAYRPSLPETLDYRISRL
jgi:hypothetical protein